MSDLTCYILTPAGRGAVATICVEGAAAADCVAGLFQPVGATPLNAVALGKTLFGRWSELNEEVVVCRLGSESVEIHSHGGQAAAPAIVASLVAAGCQQADWRTWITRTATGPIEAEAQLALAEVRTQRAAAILLDQLAGALRDELTRIQAVLQRRSGDEALAAIDRLIETSVIGLRLTSAWRVVLAGRPNVGKSSLINTLLGYQRCVVFDQPGVTRDVVTASTALDGWPVELADTAGLRESLDPLEAEGVRRAEAKLAGADLVVLVFDSTEPWSAADEAVAKRLPTALLVHNKCDLSPAGAARAEGLRVSAVTGEGIPAFIEHLVARLAPQPPAPNQAVVFTARQVGLLRRAGQQLRAGDYQGSEALLTECLSGCLQTQGAKRANEPTHPTGAGFP